MVVPSAFTVPESVMLPPLKQRRNLPLHPLDLSRNLLLHPLILNLNLSCRLIPILK
jgi:hypothetical protein